MPQIDIPHPIFESRIISNNVDVNYPSRSWGLTLFHNFLKTAVEGKSYFNSKEKKKKKEFRSPKLKCLPLK